MPFTCDLSAQSENFVKRSALDGDLFNLGKWDNSHIDFSTGMSLKWWNAQG
jgi:hypothetical protein